MKNLTWKSHSRSDRPTVYFGRSPRLIRSLDTFTFSDCFYRSSQSLITVSTRFEYLLCRIVIETSCTDPVALLAITVTNRNTINARFYSFRSSIRLFMKYINCSLKAGDYLPSKNSPFWTDVPLSLWNANAENNILQKLHFYLQKSLSSALPFATSVITNSGKRGYHALSLLIWDCNDPIRQQYK